VSVKRDEKSLYEQCKPKMMNSLTDSVNWYFVNNFKLVLTIVLLKVRKDVKLTTLGGRLFHMTVTRSINSCHAR